MEFFISYLHEKRVTIVHWIAQLEGEHGIGSHLLEVFPQFGWSESVAVESVVPSDSIEYFELSANQPITARIDELDVRVIGVRGAELTGASLLFAVLEELGGTQNRNRFAFVAQSHRQRAI